MERFLKIVAIIIIILGLYSGVRYISTMIHYACANPLEDCPPPFYGLAQIGYYGTGGSLIPVFDAKFKHLETAPLKNQEITNQ